MASSVPTSVPVLVTGASSGIGEEFARRFAGRGHPVTVVARRGDRLERLAEHLRTEHSVGVDVAAADLQTARGRTATAKLLKDGRAWILVNNAGFGSRGRAVELDADREHNEVQLNVVAVHELTFAILPALVQHGTGGVINVASTASFQPLPYMATYGATKAFVLSFTEAIAEELKGTGARAMALCPGPVETEFDTLAGVQDYFELSRPLRMGPEKCVAIALRAFDRGTTVCIPGALNVALAQAPRLTPRILTRKVSGRVFQPR
ncbi:MAG: SDR family oxidoreductase [Candidatus Dormibacteraeota bacterium]|nr:SDR family oxidoreductase [Candidatus Dormibacteraeota bacterium]